MLTGTIVNTATVILGSLIGMLLGNILPERLRDTVMKGLGLCTLYIGITGMFGSENPLITIIAIAVGAAIGELLDLDGHLNRFADGLERKFRKNGGGKTSIAEGFVTASLVFCVGAMTIVGALNDGLTGDHQMLFTKATLDFVSSMVFASSMGIGVLLAAAAVFVIQGSIASLASLVAPLLQSGNTIAEMTVVGSVLIVGLGLNILGLTKLKVMNYVPAIFLPILLCLFM
ncbi:DUF554 domain-containing protein [Dysosmobacter sp.]|uniref:DUF554 domain-containing protein n=1 Tax=Dysosmobacter sp. TaxID=2591382 RepID=UPI002A8DCFB4|nr:DUF554 domain-containing protein [Dysosmobacter sp.]MDY3281098.1 DUF554 domain-containing protein [Dysosmobacter sp.]